ncbi:MAG TPA: copper resistance CopC family protein [Candidatus Binataceae bacterium]|nr:copper resistance CopC family protein [Candidatus Binataceae bacterium]
MIRAIKIVFPLAFLMFASTALAHCFPDRSTPSAASSLTSPPSQVEVHFDNPFDPAGTSVRVLNRDGDVVSGAGAASADHRSMTAPLKPLSPGQYFVKWRATSQDGDHTLGAYSFTIKSEP